VNIARKLEQTSQWKYSITYMDCSVHEWQVTEEQGGIFLSRFCEPECFLDWEFELFLKCSEIHDF